MKPDSRDTVITMEQRTDPWGGTVWSAPETDPPAHRAVDYWQDMRRNADDGALSVRQDGADRTLSVLPTERMAGEPDAWADVIRTLRESEDGTNREDVVARPGGMLAVERAGGEHQLSRLPKERMAAVNAEPSSADVDEIMRIDPNRVEDWTPVRTGLLNGWKFRLKPTPSADWFKFLAFRSPADGNRFRVFVIKPDVDSLRGHAPHMIETVVGGQNIPVICGPRGEAAADLRTARLHASKWAAYTYQRMIRGVRPGFSE